eukprot:CAMPEP_0206247136 /NCGR_PEP_ID=MMETSP0047_2-20121206/19645_1 /ASSEMBLY_ACC=CAM_ASM_000192 /TAXON_ID=195065 /ORGANISM="Chroomonas mesostigmatica_cf, Strain CCMP1168" /LENGTH=124 /DNA_ID=CAMNT_0053672633 /DNA_START=25 /DNA_END=399 /DNA_ORIENTATION=+
MALKLSEEKREEFEKLQESFMGQRKQHAAASMQLSAIERERQHRSITQQDLKSLPEGTIMYKQVGKMFMQAPAAAVMGELDGEIKGFENMISELGGKRETYEKAMKETEGKLQEIIKAAQSAAA